MDVDVKNSLEKLLMVCDSIQEFAPKYNDIRDTVINDILYFIKTISESGSDERIKSFSRFYLDSSSYANTVNSSDEIPESLVELCELDNTVLQSRNISVSNLYLSFILDLGKHYMFSKYDKNEIDQEAFNKYVSKVTDYISEHKKTEVEAKVLAAESGEKANDSVKFNESAGDTKEEVPEKTIEQLMDKLNGLIGLTGVKKEVSSLINMLKINKMREDAGLKTIDVSKHLVFLGNPGTGKTTVARLLSQIYKQLGILETGQLVEVDREGLVAGFVGQTATKTKEKIDEAMGGILFIDEAYTLAKEGNDFGQESIDTLLKAMEDMRDKFVVIVAGYPKPMEKFLESNPGLKSRFNKYIQFEDYTPSELFEIFEYQCKSMDLRLDIDAIDYFKEYLEDLCSNKPENFANGREMRNIFEKAAQNQADRLVEDSDISVEELMMITREDISKAISN